MKSAVNFPSKHKTACTGVDYLVLVNNEPGIGSIEKQKITVSKQIKMKRLKLNDIIKHVTLTGCGQLQFAIGRVVISLDFITNIFVMLTMPFDDSPTCNDIKKEIYKVMLKNKYTILSNLITIIDVATSTATATPARNPPLPLKIGTLYRLPP